MTEIFTLDPNQGTSQLAWQGCHVAADGYDSITIQTIGGRQCFQFQGIQTPGGPLKPTSQCRGARTDTTAVSALTFPNPSPFNPPTPAEIANGQDVIWLSTGIYLPTDFPVISGTHGKWFGLHEIFGAPYVGSPGFVLTINGANHLAFAGQDLNASGVHTQYTYHDFGPVQLGVWYDVLWQIRPNSLRVVNGKNVSNEDGWVQMWLSINNNPQWTLGSPVSLSSTNNAFGTQTNVDQLKMNIVVPGYTWPTSGSGDMGLWTYVYTAGTWQNPELGDFVAFHDRVKCGWNQSDVT